MCGSDISPADTSHWGRSVQYLTGLCFVGGGGGGGGALDLDWNGL